MTQCTKYDCYNRAKWLLSPPSNIVTDLVAFEDAAPRLCDECTEELVDDQQISGNWWRHIG